MTNSTTRHPVILFPGIAGSRLQTENAFGVKSPLWFNGFQMLKFLTNLSQNQITAQEEDLTVSTQEENLTVSQAIIASYKTEADILKERPLTPAESWKKHMRLQADGKKPEIEADGANLLNRPVEGLEGIKGVYYRRFLELEIQKIDQEMKYFQDLVDKLKTEFSYIENEDLIGHPYDWRVAPGGLEERYQTFTKLKDKIETLYNTYPLPVVLIAHSMGNRVVQYFLKWIETTVSETWVDKYIERYIAISPPWIGSPQAIYRLSDSAIILPSGNNKQTVLNGMKDVLQSFSSIPWLFPVEGQYQYFNTENNEEIGYVFGYVANSVSQTLTDYQPLTVQQTLEKAQAQTTTLAHQATFYQNDPLISETGGTIGSELVKCPPVNKLDVIYSTGFPTPVGAYYQDTDNKLQIATNLGSDEAIIKYPHKDGLEIKQGIIRETHTTEQQIQVDFPDGGSPQNSGDLIVPYGSLTYFKKWKKENPNKYIEGHEFSCLPIAPGEKVDTNLNHNAIVAHPDVLTKIIQLLSESNA